MITFLTSKVINFISGPGKTPKTPIRYDSFKNVAVDEKAMLHPRKYAWLPYSLGGIKLSASSNSSLHETVDAKVINEIVNSRTSSI